jgi:hypothetical protein
MNPSDLFDQVVQAAPAFEVVRREHIADNGALLSHVLMADVLRFLESHFSGVPFAGAEPPTADQVRAALQVLDRGLVEGDEDTDNAISVSFVESIEYTSFFSQLEPFLGPEIRKEIQRQNAWRP